MEFIVPNPTLLRRSKCGHYLIEKEIGEDGATRYAVWVFVKSVYGFKTANEAVEEARSLEAAYAAEFQAVRAQASAPAADGAKSAQSNPGATRESK